MNENGNSVCKKKKKKDKIDKSMQVTSKFNINVGISTCQMQSDHLSPILISSILENIEFYLSTTRITQLRLFMDDYYNQYFAQSPESLPKNEIMSFLSSEKLMANFSEYKKKSMGKRSMNIREGDKLINSKYFQSEFLISKLLIDLDDDQIVQEMEHLHLSFLLTNIKFSFLSTSHFQQFDAFLQSLSLFFYLFFFLFFPFSYHAAFPITFLLFPPSLLPFPSISYFPFSSLLVLSNVLSFS